MFDHRCIFPSSHLNRRERYLGRFGTWGWERCLRAGANVALRSREYLGIRPAPHSGLPPKLAGRGQAAARNRREPSPRKRGPGLLRRDGTSRGVAVCLCFPAIRETSRGRYPRCAFRRSASLFSLRGRFTEPTIHAKGFAGGDDACLEQERCELHARTHTHSVIRELDPPAGPKPLRRGEGPRIHHASTFEFVMPGLDPGIHPSSRESFEEDGLPGQARQ
jgi:hypothetical protein